MKKRENRSEDKAHSRIGVFLYIAHHVLLLAALLDLVGDELLVLFKRTLDVQFEAHDVVEHALDFRVQFLAEGVRADCELLISSGKG